MIFAFMLNPQIGGPLFSTDQDCLLLSVSDMKFISYLFIGIKSYICISVLQDRKKLWVTVALAPLFFLNNSWFILQWLTFVWQSIWSVITTQTSLVCKFAGLPKQTVPSVQAVQGVFLKVVFTDSYHESSMM